MVQQRLRILIAETTDRLSSRVTAIVGDSGYYDIEQSPLETACQTLKQGGYDLLLVGDAEGETHAIESLRKCSGEIVVPFPLIYCCSSIDKTVIDAAFAAGATDVVRLSEMDITAFGDLLRNAIEKIQQRMKMNSMLRTIIDLVPGMIYVKDRDGQILLANRATAEFYDTTVQEITGTNQSQWQRDTDELALSQQQDHSVIDSGECIERVEDQLTTADGVHHMLETSKVPLLFADQKVNAVLAVSRDVTERKHLQRSQERILAALDAAADAVMITGLDGVIEYVNSAFEKITGYTAVEVIGQTPKILKSDKQDDAFYDEMWSILLAGETFRAVITNRHKNGSLFEAEETITPVYDEAQNMVAFVAFERDVTEKRLAEQALRNSEERFSLAAEGSSDGLWDWDITHDLFYVSPRVCSMMGLAEDDKPITTSSDILALLDREQQEAMLKRIQRHLKGLTDYFSHEFYIILENGETKWLKARGLASRDSTTEQAIRMAGSLADITAFKRSEVKLVEQSLRDPLTGLANRKMFVNHLTSAVHASDVHDNYRAAVLYISINRLKELRTTMGSSLGDRLISKVARRLRDCIRPSDVIAHVHAGEFGILLPQIMSLKSAEMMVQRIKQSLNEPFRESAQQIRVTASMGITIINRDSTRVPEYILRDAALAQSVARKQSESFKFFDQQMIESAATRITLESEIDMAIAENQFLLYLQPIMDIQMGKLSGFEALIRWMHPEKGMIPPDQFISVAEETAQIVEIGKWVLIEAFERLKGWQTQPGMRNDLYISVNLSPLQLRDPSTLLLIRQLLTDAPFDASQLRIEITESAILDDAENTHVLLETLRETGTQLYMDDFGTGYSSLSYLHRYPFDVLKIDQSFTFKIDSDPAIRKITESIVQLATHLDLKVVAEGVENEAQMNLLIGMGCHYGQGYHFSRPLPQDEVECFIDTVAESDAESDG